MVKVSIAIVKLGVCVCETLHIALNCVYASLSLCTLIATKSSFSSLFRTVLSLTISVNAADNSSVPVERGLHEGNC